MRVGDGRGQALGGDLPGSRMLERAASRISERAASRILERSASR